MSVTDLAAVTNQVQKFWSPMFMPELRAASLIPSLINKDYEGQIKAGGDTVYVSQIVAPTGQNLTVGTDADMFDSQALTTNRISVQANKRAVAAFEITDLAALQSQLESEDSEIRAALQYAIIQQMNQYIYGLVSPSQSAPDHLLNSTATFDATALGICRTKAATAKWLKTKGWYTLCDPVYYGHILAAQTMTSRDYVEGETPVFAGQIVNKRFGFNILEDDSLGASQAVSFSPDFAHLVMQTQPTFKLSDLHSNNKFGYLLSVDVIYGAALGIGGSVKHILTNADASASTVVMA